MYRKVSRTCSEISSDYEISQRLSKANNTVVKVATDSVISSYEQHGGNLFYRYEKAYTASASGFYNTPFYSSTFVVAKNGKVYMIQYERDNDTNNFNDVFDMLNSISFDSGNIKIKINNQLIYPDSNPIIYEGRTLVPIRAIAEAMNYNVNWNSAERTVEIAY